MTKKVSPPPVRVGNERLRALLPGVGPTLVLLAIVTVYLGAGISLWIVVGALMVLGVLAGIYLIKRDVERGAITGVCFAIFLPTLANWHLTIPLFGAVLLVAGSLMYRPWRGIFVVNTSMAVVACSVVVVVGVAAFQVLADAISSSSTTLSWMTLPGSEYGTAAVVLVVIIAAAINSTFEELLWRVAVPRLFPSRRWLVFQWLGVSVCFGICHLYGTPGGMLGMIFASIFGLAMCVIRELSRGSVVWIIGIHFVADVILIGALYGSQF